MKRQLINITDNLVKKIFSNLHFKSLILRNTPILNINATGEPSQKRVLICYLTEAFHGVPNQLCGHPKHFQQMQITNYFISKGYAVDVCNYVDVNSILSLNVVYDVIVGQGISYDKAVDRFPGCCSILFLTENNPEVVEKNYKTRIEYFQQRHPTLNYKQSIARKGVFTTRSLELSDAIIAFNSTYSAKSLTRYCKSVYPIAVNTIANNSSSISSSEIVKNKYNFVWLGSVGFIHKGLDILLDVFKEIPYCTLNVYGVPKSELSLWNKLKGDNTFLHPNIDVTSEKFIEEVVRKNTFVISASCSEGIQTGVATCMRSGLIPIVTKDCGYDEHESTFMLEDFKIEYIIEKLKQITSLDENILTKMSASAREFANNRFSNEQFTVELSSALNNILSQYE